jgi:hypothetical protein
MKFGPIRPISSVTIGVDGMVILVPMPVVPIEKKVPILAIKAVGWRPDDNWWNGMYDGVMVVSYRKWMISLICTDEKSPVFLKSQFFFRLHLTRPYDLPNYRLDGLDGRSVEYWSGGMHLVGVNGCNLQRIVSLDPFHFSRHLLYHTSNNKQRTLRIQHRFSGRNVNEFWAQINTIRMNAISAMKAHDLELDNT